MWEKYKSQIIMAVAGTILTGVLGFTGKALLDSYTHTNNTPHFKTEDLKEINEKLVQIKTTVDKNEQALRHVRFHYLNDRYSKLTQELRDECDGLRSKLYPFGGSPEPK